MNYLRDKLKAMLMVNNQQEEPDDAWWSGKLFTEATEDVGGYVGRFINTIYSIQEGRYITLNNFFVFVLKIPKGARTLTINTKNTTYPLGSESRQGMCYLNSIEGEPVNANITCNNIMPTKTIDIDTSYKYIGITARNNITSIRNNTIFEFSK